MKSAALCSRRMPVFKSTVPLAQLSNQLSWSKSLGTAAASLRATSIIARSRTASPLLSAQAIADSPLDFLAIAFRLLLQHVRRLFHHSGGGHPGAPIGGVLVVFFPALAVP